MIWKSRQPAITTYDHSEALQYQDNNSTKRFKGKKDETREFLLWTVSLVCYWWLSLHLKKARKHPNREKSYKYIVAKKKDSRCLYIHIYTSGIFYTHSLHPFVEQQASCRDETCHGIFETILLVWKLPFLWGKPDGAECMTVTAKRIWTHGELLSTTAPL